MSEIECGVTKGGNTLGGKSGNVAYLGLNCIHETFTQTMRVWCLNNNMLELPTKFQCGRRPKWSATLDEIRPESNNLLHGLPYGVI